MDRRALLLPAVLLATMLPTTSATAATSASIISPKVDSFFTKAPVRVKVKTSRSVGSIEATLNRRPIDGAFKRIRPDLWSAKLSGERLVRGTNRLVITARGRGGQRSYASTRFVLGHRRKAFLAIHGPRRAAGVVARVQVAGAPRRLAAKLNGRRLRWPLGLVPGRKELLRLGGDDGLHFGVNRLRVLAVGAGGVYDVESRRITLPRSRPVAGAGPDRRVAAGSQLRLDGRGSRSAHGDRSALSYRWKIVRRPPGSKAQLLQASSARPLLDTDEPGTFRVRLLATEPASGSGAAPSASDVTTISSVADVPPIGEPIETMVANGKSGAEADSGIKVGETTYWMGAPQGNTAQVLILDRETLEPLYSASYKTEGESSQFSQKLAELGSKGLAVISVPNLDGNAQRNVLLALSAADIGVGNSILFPTYRAGWSAIGVFGTHQGGTIGPGFAPDKRNGASYAGDLSGYLQKSAGGFVYVPGDRVAFQTDAGNASPGQNKMVVGGATYVSEALPSCASGGFQVVVLMAETLAPLRENTFPTNGCGAAAEEFEQNWMATFLAEQTVKENNGWAEGPKLILVQSVGPAYGAGGGSSWNKIATAIEGVGGTPAVFAAARSSYALVGAVGVSPLQRAEASQTLTGKAAQISGVLKPNEVGAYAPELSSPVGGTTFPLSTIAYQPAQAWPESQSPEDRAALAYIAEDVLGLEKPTIENACYVPAMPDVRSQYCNLGYANSWEHFATKLERAKFSPGHGFKEPEWIAVTKQLEEHEFENVQRVWELVAFLQQIFTTSTEPDHVDLEHIAIEIEKALTPPPQNITTGWWLELLGNLSSTASYFKFSGEEIEFANKVMGVLQGAMFESASSLFESSGEPVLNAYNVKVEDLALDLSNRFLADSKGIGKVGEILVSDYGKLQAVQSSGMLGYTPETFESTIDGTGWGVEAWAYEKLLPVGFEAIKLEGQTPAGKPLENASELQCEAGSGRNTFPYNPFDQVTGGEYKLTAPSEAFGVLVRTGSKLPQEEGPEVHPAQPSAKALAPLVEPSNGTLGYYAPWFWHSVYGFPSGKTRVVSC